MANEGLKINSYISCDQERALNEANIYVNYSADYTAGYQNFIHNSCELLFVEQGEAEYKINNEIYPLGKRDILIIGAMETHFRKITRPPFIRYGLTLLPSFLGMIPMIGEYAALFRTPSPEESRSFRNVKEEQFADLVGIVRKLHEETTQEQRGSTEMVISLLQQLTILLMRLSGRETRTNQTDAYQLMLKLRRYIDFHYQEDLSLNELSRIFYLQPNTISRNFKNSFDVNVNHYINKVRISKAVQLLEQDAVSVTELSACVGYSSVNTFLRQFHDVMGTSPYKYRKNYLEHLRQMKLWNLFEGEEKPPEGE